MNTSLLSEIESKAQLLSREEQLLLIERLVQNMRRKTDRKRDFEKELESMASDPEIQRELKTIEKEFAFTEGDGLEEV